MEIQFASLPLQTLIEDLAADVTTHYNFVGTHKKLGSRMRSSDMARWDELKGTLSSPAYWKDKFRAAYDAKGWLDKDIIPDKYPRTTVKAETVELEAYKESTFDLTDSHTYEYNDDGSIIPIADRSKVAPVDVEVPDVFSADIAVEEDESEPEGDKEYSEDYVDIGLEDGDEGGTDFPNGDANAVWSQFVDDDPAQPISESQGEAEAADRPSSPHSEPPSSANFIGSAFSLGRSSVGTKRSISDFIGGDDDVADTSSRRPKKSRPMTAAERAAAQAPTPSSSSLTESKTLEPQADDEGASSDSD